MPVALITGGAGSVGVAAAKRLVQDGWSVVLADIDLPAAQKAAKAIGEGASAVAMDVTKLDEVRAGVDSVARRFTSVDAVIAAAGGRSGASIGPFMDAPPETWTQIVELHLTGVLNVYYAALPHMQARRSGALVSVSAVEAYRGAPKVSGLFDSEGGCRCAHANAGARVPAT